MLLPTSTSWARFERVKVIQKVLLDKTKVILPTLDRLGIEYHTFYEYVLDQDQSTEESPYPLITIELAPISADQFIALKSAFHNSSRIQYIQSHRYSLIDFLPPIIQALDHHYYIGNAEPNCAGTAFNLVNLNSEVFCAFTPHQIVVDSFFSSADYVQSSKLSESEQLKIINRISLMSSLNQYRETEEGKKRILQAYKNHPDPGSARCSKELGQLAPPELDSKMKAYTQLIDTTSDLRQFGDFLVISEKDYFSGIDENSQTPKFNPKGGNVHIAVAIDGNLFFEKPDPSLNSPFRLRLLQDIEKTPSFPRSNPEVIYQYYKVNPEITGQAIQILETLNPENLFWLGSREKNFRHPKGRGAEEERFHCYSIVYDSDGRGFFSR